MHAFAPKVLASGALAQNKQRMDAAIDELLSNRDVDPIVKFLTQKEEPAAHSEFDALADELWRISRENENLLVGLNVDIALTRAARAGGGRALSLGAGHSHRASQGACRNLE